MNIHGSFPCSGCVAAPWFCNQEPGCTHGCLGATFPLTEDAVWRGGLDGRLDGPAPNSIWVICEVWRAKEAAVNLNGGDGALTCGTNSGNSLNVMISHSLPPGPRLVWFWTIEHHPTIVSTGSSQRLVSVRAEWEHNQRKDDDTVTLNNNQDLLFPPCLSSFRIKRT